MWWDQPITAIDTETTGLDWFEDRVIQVGCSYFDSGKYLGGHSHIIDSGRPSAPEAIATHHITDEMQKTLGESPHIIFPLIKHALAESRILVIMNAPFDLNFLISEGVKEFPKYIIDPLVIDRFYSKNRIPSLARGKRTLKAMSERYGITDYPLHDAGHDSRRVGELAIEMAQRHGQLGRSPLNELMKKQRKWHKDWSDDFASYASAKCFGFTKVNWPHREDKWQADQLPLSFRTATNTSPRVRRAGAQRS
jgi:DNA polymerase III subunit epsilon